MKSEREIIRSSFVSYLSSRACTRDPGVIKGVLPFISSLRSVVMRGISRFCSGLYPAYQPCGMTRPEKTRTSCQGDGKKKWIPGGLSGPEDDITTIRLGFPDAARRYYSAMTPCFKFFTLPPFFFPTLFKIFSDVII